jgi:general stress protein CsbA
MKIKNSRVSIILAIILVAFPLILAYMDVSGFLKYEVVKILAGNLVFEG